MAACLDYKPLHASTLVKSWLCVHLSFEDTCEYGPGRFEGKPCPWEGRPDREHEYDLIPPAPPRKK